MSAKSTIEVSFDITFFEDENEDVLYIEVCIRYQNKSLSIPKELFQIHQASTDFPKLFIVDGMDNSDLSVGINIYLLRAIIDQYEQWKTAYMLERN